MTTRSDAPRETTESTTSVMTQARPERAVNGGPPGRDRTLTGLAVGALAGTAWFILGVALMHVLRSDLNPARHTISEYAVGPYGWVQATNFVAAGVATACLAAGLRLSLERPGRLGPVLLGAWAVAQVVEAFVHADGDGPATAAGALHVAVSLFGFACGVAAMFVFARRFRREPSWRGYAGPTRWWAGAAVAAFVAIPFLGTSGAGTGQRIFAAVLGAWLFETARRLRRSAVPAYRGSRA